MNIYVGNLSYELEEEELEHVFGQFGAVNRARIITDRETGRPRGFGFVEMARAEDGAKAIDGLNGTLLLGRELVVNEARARQDAPRQQHAARR
ncbi:MAG: RNA-binding protein [Armatimonadetes bacterium]|nr:RNA-binding protein [Armatimonadota bacterium]